MGQPLLWWVAPLKAWVLAPLDHDWAQIYVYLATKVMGFRPSGKGVEIAADIKVEQLDSYL